MQAARAFWMATHLTSLAVLVPSVAHAADADREVPGVPGSEPDLQPRWVPWVTPNAQLQMWFTPYDQDRDPQADPGGYGDPELDTGFNIPRARIGFRGGFKWVDFNVRLGTSRPYDTLSEVPPAVELIDAWARLTFESVAGITRITMGEHNIPFSREQQMSSNDLIFQERAVSTHWLAPQQDLGASIRHDWTYLGAAVGVYNGGGSLLGDVDPGVMFAGRLEAHVGGDTYRTNSQTNALGIGASYIYNKEYASTTQRVGVDFLGRIVGLTLMVEGQMNFVTPDADPTIELPDVYSVTKRWGGFAQLSYYKELGIGAIEPAVRFSYFDDNRDLKDNGDVGILHAGLSWREPVPFMDFGAGYIARFEFQGVSIPNDSVRVWAGLRYPSRNYVPLNLVDVFRRMGEKPLMNTSGVDSEDKPAKKGKKAK